MYRPVYLMYTLRPIRSWQHFFNASLIYQVYLRMAHGIAESYVDVLGNLARHVDSADRKMRCFEQSLYWSCFKSECEFRVELPLPQSEISYREYPNLFPSLPLPLATDVENTSVSEFFSREAGPSSLSPNATTEPNVQPHHRGES